MTLEVRERCPCEPLRGRDMQQSGPCSTSAGTHFKVPERRNADLELKIAGIHDSDVVLPPHKFSNLKLKGG